MTSNKPRAYDPQCRPWAYSCMCQDGHAEIGHEEEDCPLCTAEQVVARLREALTEIARGAGAFSHDPLEHAANKSMKEIARTALRQAAQSGSEEEAPCDHEWVTQRQGGHPANEDSYCRKCGLEEALAVERDLVDWIALHCDLDQSAYRLDIVELRWYDSEGDERTTRVPAVAVPGEARFDPCMGLRAAIQKAQEEESHG